jgi:type I restriction-modification system DNA methylase subunit
MVRKFLIEELQKRKVKASEHPSYSTPKGRMEPDILLQNGGDYVVETKLGGDLFTAFAELHDYLKYIKVSGGFAVILPDELRTSVPIDWLRKMASSPKLKYSVAGMFSDARNITQVEGTLYEIADWISEQVLAPPAKIEVDTSLAIKVLRNAVSYISASTRKLKTWELEDIFGGKSVFENILQYEEKKYPLREMQEAAAYLLINQIMFYHVLSSVDPVKFKPLDEDALSHPANLNRYFERVLRVDYTPVFGFDIASRLPVEVVPTLKNVIGITKALGAERIGYDILGKIFHDLIPYEIRKAVAAFYTNNEAAELLAHLAIDSPSAKVTDLAVGSGTLLVSSYRRKRSLLPSFDIDDHKRFLTQDLTGIDIMPFAAHLAVVHLSLQSPQFKTDKVRVAVWDSTELEPGRVIPAIAKELKVAYKRPTLEMFMEGNLEFGEEAYIKKGAIVSEMLGSDAIPLEKVDVTIMNPPFTRQERIPKEYKKHLTQKFRAYKEYLHGQLGFYGYFIFLADMFLKEGGRMAFVLPATMLRIRSTLGLRNLLINNYQIEYVITSWQRSAFSESARFTEILLVAKKTVPHSENSKCAFVALKRMPKNSEEATQIAAKIKATKEIAHPGEVHENDVLSLKVVTQRELKDSVNNLFAFIACSDFKLRDMWNEVVKTSKGKLGLFSKVLGRVDGEVLRGVETRSWVGIPFHSTFICKDVSRAIKKTDAWLMEKQRKNALVAVNRFTKERISIPLKALAFGVRRASGVDTIDISESLDYIVVKDFPGIERFFTGNLGERFKKTSKIWEEYIKSRQANFLINRRFDISARNTNVLACYTQEPATGMNLWSVKGFSDDDAKILTLWFNSTLNLMQILMDRIEARGAWITLHKYGIEELKILDPSKLESQDKKHLLEIFESIKGESLPSLLEQLKQGHRVRKRIDRAILEMLGYQGDIESTLERLYHSLAVEIDRLKEMMRERTV